MRKRWIHLSLRVFGLLSSILLFPQRFGRYVLRPSSGACRTREPTRNFELRPLLNLLFIYSISVFYEPSITLHLQTSQIYFTETLYNLIVIFSFMEIFKNTQEMINYDKFLEVSVIYGISTLYIGIIYLSLRQWPATPGFNPWSSHTQKLKKWYLIPSWLTLSIIREAQSLKSSNRGKGVTPPYTLVLLQSKRETSDHPRPRSPSLFYSKCLVLVATIFSVF